MYTTTAKVAAALGLQLLSTEQAAYFTNVLDSAIDAMIDRETETTFGGTGEKTIYVDGMDIKSLVIPTMNTITELAIVDEADNATVMPQESYYTYPRGVDDVFALRNKSGTWEEGDQNYRVKGVLGYKTIPYDVSSVATDIATAMITKNVTGIKSEKVGDWQVTYNDVQDVVTPRHLDILAKYRRLSRSV